VDNAQELMVASDIIVTKPGGLTIAEIINMELVPLFICAIPGQETANIEALKHYGIGRDSVEVNEVKEIILGFKDNPQELESLRGKIRQLKKPFACREISNVIR